MDLLFCLQLKSQYNDSDLMSTTAMFNILLQMSQKNSPVLDNFDTNKQKILLLKFANHPNHPLVLSALFFLILCLGDSSKLEQFYASDSQFLGRLTELYELSNQSQVNPDVRKFLGVLSNFAKNIETCDLLDKDLFFPSNVQVFDHADQHFIRLDSVEVLHELREWTPLKQFRENHNLVTDEQCIKFFTARHERLWKNQCSTGEKFGIFGATADSDEPFHIAKNLTFNHIAVNDKFLNPTAVTLNFQLDSGTTFVTCIFKEPPFRFWIHFNNLEYVILGHFLRRTDSNGTAPPLQIIIDNVNVTNTKYNVGGEAEPSPSSP